MRTVYTVHMIDDAGNYCIGFVVSKRRLNNSQVISLYRSQTGDNRKFMSITEHDTCHVAID